MKRFGQLIRVRPEFEAEYIKYHAQVWPSPADDPGLQHSQLFHFPQDHVLYAYFEYMGRDLS
jgi:L-rhamnose mutarotase